MGDDQQPRLQNESTSERPWYTGAFFAGRVAYLIDDDATIFADPTLMLADLAPEMAEAILALDETDGAGRDGCEHEPATWESVVSLAEKLRAIGGAS